QTSPRHPRSGAGTHRAAVRVPLPPAMLLCRQRALPHDAAGDGRDRGVPSSALSPGRGAGPARSPPMTSLLEVEGLTKIFHHRRVPRSKEAPRAVDDIGFALDRGRTLAIVGESGAGKSTTARLVLRLIEPDAGTIHFDGTDLLALSSADIRRQRRR